MYVLINTRIRYIKYNSFKLNFRLVRKIKKEKQNKNESKNGEGVKKQKIKKKYHLFAHITFTLKVPDSFFFIKLF